MVSALTRSPGSERAPDEAPAPAFRVCGLSFAYPGQGLCLRDVSFDVAVGERVAILGANGSGKSTLLKVLDGLAFPSEGSVTVFGRPLTEAALRDERTAFAFRRRVGLVFQSADAQLFSPTVRDEIAFGPLQMGLDRAEVEARLADVAAMLGIEPLLDRAPFRLSGGEKRKVALGSVLVINPDAILLDEPTGGLDPRSRWWLVETLDALHGAGKTIVLSTHDLDIAPHVADRAIVLGEDHAVAAAGPVKEILAEHDLLMRVNLIHEHLHAHGGVLHSHAHHHADDEHSHDH